MDKKQQGGVTMLTRVLARRLFEAFSIQRWNDRIRPIELTQMDAHGMQSVLTFFLGIIEEENGEKIDWKTIIRGNLFTLLKKIMLSDIKLDVVSIIKKEHNKEYEKLNNWVIEQYKKIIDNTDFMDNFEKHLHEERNYDNINYLILKGAHKYSTYREFAILKPLNKKFPNFAHVKKQINQDIDDCMQLKGMRDLKSKLDLFDAICLIEQLRYQTRWSQTCRIPQTSVLGHCMLVAAFALLLTDKKGVCEKRIFNNFYGGLFHDLPECVTRDIVTPVKKATPDFENVIKKIEKEHCDTKLYPKIPEKPKKELKYLVGHSEEGRTITEFSNRIINEKGKVLEVPGQDMDDLNSDELCPIEGELIKICDDISAFLEAYMSIQQGITSRHLEEGMTRIKTKYLKEKTSIPQYLEKFFMDFE